MARYTPVGSPEQYRLPVDVVAGRVHFLDHLAPVWAALPPDRRGTFWVKSDVLEHARRRRYGVKRVIDEIVVPSGLWEDAHQYGRIWSARRR